MKLVNILLGTVFLIIVFNVLLPKKSMLDSFISGNDGVLTNEDKDEIIKNRGKADSESFPIPESTSPMERLSPGITSDVKAIGNAIIQNPDLFVVNRSVVYDKESHYPEYYLKDNMSGNTIGSTELAFVGEEEDEAIAWSDENVSQYPKYYKSEFKGGLTNVGSFFDQNNQYVDLTGPRSEANIGDVCYKSKEGVQICLENDKLQNIPPSLISDVNSCAFLNNIGLLQYSNSINETSEKVMNGGFLYSNVQGSQGVKNTPSEILQPQVLTCVL